MLGASLTALFVIEIPFREGKGRRPGAVAHLSEGLRVEKDCRWVMY